ncbi:GNAT family N-acetyltransferase [Winogradskya consettensis]|uniref:N-acetyltransferase n=1 Tax=Winogradskya consettensis TaxID=113560 RepID=A0A919T167_9ACTN|nr:GNAT family N-acetyltransferase [Actinoplanes consettensis]GIM83892.1 N-acetyltransferase [Actinoplanes consettensis]
MLVIKETPVGDPAATTIVRLYLTEMVERYYERPATAAEVDAASDDDPDVLLVAFGEGGEPVGCAGLRLAEPSVGEVTKVYVHPSARRLGLGRRLLAAIEDAALDRGLRTLRLDTRSDLVEARALYAAIGFREIPPHRDLLYADHWYAKDLAQE